MKLLKSIYFLIFLILIGCKNDEEPQSAYDWDCGPYVVFINIQDTDGNNLFSDDYHGIISLDSITPEFTYTYNNETKPVCYLKSHTDAILSYGSRAYFDVFYGIGVADWYYADKQPRICFGEFSGPYDHDESIIINWPDGTHSTIELTARAVKLFGPYHNIKTRIDDGEWVETQKGYANVTLVK